MATLGSPVTPPRAQVHDPSHSVCVPHHAWQYISRSVLGVIKDPSTTNFINKSQFIIDKLIIVVVLGRAFLVGIMLIDWFLIGGFVLQ